MSKYVKKKHVYYMAVTPDKYELPIYVAETAQEMADVMGIKKNSVFSIVCHKRGGVHSGYKLIRINGE